MLYSKLRRVLLIISITTLQFFISVITYQTPVFANSKLQTVEEYRVQGYEEQQRGNFNAALENYSKAISLGLENAVVFNDMGVLYEQIGFRSRAEQYYLEATKVDPNYLPAYMNLAYLYQRAGQNDKAFEYFKIRFERSAPDDPWGQKAKEEMIKIHPEYEKKIIAQEAENFKRQLELKAQNDFLNTVLRANEHAAKGDELAGAGRYKQAMEEYNQALTLTPKNPKIIKARDKVFVDLMKENVGINYEQAMKALQTGDAPKAREYIQKMLSIIPNKPIKISE